MVSPFGFRFLVSEGIISLFPSLTALCLDRHLSNHGHILLRELSTDYGPTPFRFYHSWFKWDDFDAMVEQAWNSFSHFDANGLIRELIDIDKALDRGNITDEILFKRIEMVQQLHDAKQMETRDNLQKSKIKWAIEGDENSKYFHGIINKKRSQLWIHGIFTDGEWKTDPGAVKEAFKVHFVDRFKQPINGRLKLNISFNNRLSTDQVVDLDRGVSRDEIRVAVWDCEDNKSPGPDGFTFEFFKRYWRFVGPDFCFAVECFFDNGTFPMGCNSSFIALIPKVMDAKFVTDFRPISLIGCVYKVITKILANRLAMVISDLVSDTKSTFFANRQILDGPFILNELLDWCKRKKKQSMIFKVVFAKAYDSVFKGIQLDGTTSISHLFYADDAVFVGEWSDSNMKSIVTILKCFFLASGLKINIHKSQVLGIGVPRILVTQAAYHRIGCVVMQRPFRYLGVMIGDCMSRKHAWDDTIQKLHARLSNWKVKTLSIGEKLHGYWIIQALYGHHSALSAVGYSSLWSSILRELHVLKHKGFDFLSHCKKRVGDGQSTRFWYDHWISDQPLYVLFPRLFALELDKDISVTLKLESTSLEASFRRPVRDGAERQQLIDLNLLTGSTLLSPSKDRWICDLSGDGEFRVKVARTKLDDVFLPSDLIATRWVKFIPIKVNVFAWRVRLDRLPTRVNLLRRGVGLESSLCPMCGLLPEDIHHVIFRCEIAQAIFRKICRWWDLDWYDLHSFSDWLSWFSAIRLSSSLKLLLEGVFYTAWWHLWAYRNQSVFAENPPRCSVIFDDIVSRSFFWCSSRCKRFVSWETWMKNPYLISL
ncbi:RNA-directed DNA polymerase, eukaryota [Tanacetum coccineum]